MTRPVCTNGNKLEEYPEQYKQATRIGINFRGWVEYANTENRVIYELVYPVHDTRNFLEIRQHQMLGDSVGEHIVNSVSQFSDWQYVER